MNLVRNTGLMPVTDTVRQARIDLAAVLRLAARFGRNEGIDNHFTVMLPGARCGTSSTRSPRRLSATATWAVRPPAFFGAETPARPRRAGLREAAADHHPPGGGPSSGTQPAVQTSSGSISAGWPLARK